MPGRKRIKVSARLDHGPRGDEDGDVREPRRAVPPKAVIEAALAHPAVAG